MSNINNKPTVEAVNEIYTRISGETEVKQLKPVVEVVNAILDWIVKNNGVNNSSSPSENIPIGNVIKDLTYENNQLTITKTDDTTTQIDLPMNVYEYAKESGFTESEERFKELLKNIGNNSNSSNTNVEQNNTHGVFIKEFLVGNEESIGEEVDEQGYISIDHPLNTTNLFWGVHSLNVDGTSDLFTFTSSQGFKIISPTLVKINKTNVVPKNKYVNKYRFILISLDSLQLANITQPTTENAQPTPHKINLYETEINNSSNFTNGSEVIINHNLNSTKIISSIKIKDNNTYREVLVPYEILDNNSIKYIFEEEINNNTDKEFKVYVLNIDGVEISTPNKVEEKEEKTDNKEDILSILEKVENDDDRFIAGNLTLEEKSFLVIYDKVNRVFHTTLNHEYGFMTGEYKDNIYFSLFFEKIKNFYGENVYVVYREGRDVALTSLDNIDTSKYEKYLPLLRKTIKQIYTQSELDKLKEKYEKIMSKLDENTEL